jgi:hypothetical protein
MKHLLRTLSSGMIATALLLVVSACASAPAATAAPAAPADNSTVAAPADANPTTAAGTTDSSAATAKIESYKLLKDNGSGAAGDEVKSFKPTDHVQFFDVQLTEFLKVGSVVNWVFTAVDTTAGKDVKITEANTTVTIGNHLSANLSLTKDFPVGKYKADILVDGKPIGSIEYTVAE